MTIKIQEITKENADALALPNDPFPLYGRLIPMYDGEKWDYRIERFKEEDITEDCFPDEHYCFDEMGKGFHGFSAYVDGECKGFIILYEKWNKWLYVDNILVSKTARRTGVGSALIEASLKLSKELGKLGLWLVCQDNNLSAMEFYFKNGFTLGGMNLPVYEGTKQEGKIDLYLYKRY